MAVQKDWATGSIYVPTADLTHITGDEYEMDIDWFRLQVKALEASEDGMPFADMHRHTTEVTLGGLTYARVVEILDPSFVTFENGYYRVTLVGANSNIREKSFRNYVAVGSQNSAGLVNLPAVTTAAQQATIAAQNTQPG
jgi:hypothetical protein